MSKEGDSVGIQTNLDTINLNGLISKAVDFNSNLDLTIGWDLAFAFENYVLQYGTGSLSLPWLVFGETGQSNFDLKVQNRAETIRFRIE